MNEPSSPSSVPNPPPVAVRRRGLGCVPTGCIIVVIILMLLGVGIGGMAWLISQGGQAFFSEQSQITRAAEATDEQYQAVLAKLAPFGQAMNGGHAATVEITPDDLNVLVSRSPQFDFFKHKLFLEAKDDHLGADVSLPVNPDSPKPVYFNGRVSLDASYASNGFALLLRRIDPLDPGKANTRFASFLNSRFMLEGFSRQLSQILNEGLRQQARKDPAAADLLRKLRTVVVDKGNLVITSAEVSGGATPGASTEPSPTPESVATPLN